MQQAAQVQPPDQRRVPREVQQVGPAAGLAQAAQPETGEDLADLVGDAEQVLGQRAGSPSKASASVVIPAGHFTLQFFAMTQRSIISAVVPNSKESAPSSAETTTSPPVWCAPEQRSSTASRRPCADSAWCTSATPSPRSARRT